MVRGLIDIYRHEGKLPDCRMSFCKGFTQGGSNADNVLVDSYLKGLTDGIDWEAGYEAVISDAEGSSILSLWLIQIDNNPQQTSRRCGLSKVVEAFTVGRP